MNVHSSFTFNHQKLETKGTAVGEWLKELWYIHVMEYYAATKGNELLIIQQFEWIS